MAERLTTNVRVKTTCPFCGKHDTVMVKRADYETYKSGKGLIQNIFPYLDADQREQLITGICKPCWDRTFSGC